MKLNKLDAVNLELLRTFVVAAQAPTFAEAARVRSVSVSAISQQVKALEVQLGVLLFERLGRRVRLTPEGGRLAGALERHLGHVAEALDEVTGAGRRLTGLVTVGGPRTFGAHFVTPRLASLLRDTPGLRVDQVFDVPSVLERRLVDGQLDLAVLARPAQATGLEVKAMAMETFACVAAPGLVTRLGRARDEAAFAGWPWLVFDRDLPMHGPWWRASFGRPAPMPERVVAAVAGLEPLQALAEQGVGAVVLPDYLVGPAVKAGRLVVLVPSSSSSSSRRARAATNTLFLAWRRGAPLTARAEAVRSVLLARHVSSAR